jgi:tetratricopeptide (TPR) repeat protein
MNLPLRFRPLIVLLLCSPGLRASAQSMYSGVGYWELETPAQAGKTYAQAKSLRARRDLLRALAGAYLQAHEYEALLAVVANAPIPAAEAWQNTFLLADLDNLLGNTDEAVRLLKQVPAAGLRDPMVLEFGRAHPALMPNGPLPEPLDANAGPPERLVETYLDNLEPDQAWAVIAAHSDTFLDDLATFHSWTPQFADQNLASRLLPLLRDRSQRQPENWELRLTVAQYQLLTRDTDAAIESFRQIYRLSADATTLAQTPAERVEAMRGIFLTSLSKPSGASPFDRLQSVENARDLALICLAELADERRGGPAFIRNLEKEHHGDELGWVTSLMLISSPGLVTQELESARFNNPSKNLVELAQSWLQTFHPDRNGSFATLDEVVPLTAAYAHLVPGAPPGSPEPPPSSGGLSIGSDKEQVFEILKTGNAAQKEKILAQLLARNNPGAAFFELPTFLKYLSELPDNADALRATAIILAQTAAGGESGFAACALSPPTAWYVPMSPKFSARSAGNWPDLNRIPHPFPPGAGRPDQDRPVNELVEAAFLAQSRTLADPPMTIPPTVVPALAHLAADALSPFHVGALIAEAYVLHDVAGQEEHALDLLRQASRESPSYLARFWLTAFLARQQRYKEAIEVLDGIPPIPGNFAAFLRNGRTLLEHAQKNEPLFEQRPVPTAPAKPPLTIRELVAHLNDLYGHPSSDPAELAAAEKLSHIFPAEAFFPHRADVLKTFARFGRLDEQIALITERAREFPLSADAQLSGKPGDCPRSRRRWPPRWPLIGKLFAWRPTGRTSRGKSTGPPFRTGNGRTPIVCCCVRVRPFPGMGRPTSPASASRRRWLVMRAPTGKGMDVGAAGMPAPLLLVTGSPSCARPDRTMPSLKCSRTSIKRHPPWNLIRSCSGCSGRKAGPRRLPK